MDEDRDLRGLIAQHTASPGGYKQGLSTISRKLSDLVLAGAPAGAVNEARIIRAEVLQKLGWLNGAELELSRLDRDGSAWTRGMEQGRLLVQAKIAMQRGDLKLGKAFLMSLNDRLAGETHSEIGKTYLWRQAFTLGVMAESRQARRLLDEHRSIVISGGFHQANNVIYGRIAPLLAQGGELPRGWSDWLTDVHEAGQLYLSSTVDFSGRLGNRGKSLCQALLVESLIWWKASNRYHAYFYGIVGALLLNRWGLNLESEGFGELVALFKSIAPRLFGAIKKSIAVDQLSEVDNWDRLQRSRRELLDKSEISEAYDSATIVVDEILRSQENTLRTYELLKHEGKPW